MAVSHEFHGTRSFSFGWACWSADWGDCWPTAAGAGVGDCEADDVEALVNSSATAAKVRPTITMIVRVLGAATVLHMSGSRVGRGVTPARCPDAVLNKPGTHYEFDG